MFGGVKNLAAKLLGQQNPPPPTPPPFDEDPCAGCTDPCEHPQIPSYLLKKVAYDLPLEGTVHEHHRQLLVCTGTTDWQERAENEDGSLVQALSDVSADLREDRFKWSTPETAPKSSLKFAVTAISRPTEKRTSSTDDADTPPLVSDISDPANAKAQDIILLPEGLLVPAVAPTTSAVNKLVNTWLGSGHEYNSDALIRAIGARRLPYSWIVLICAHRKRDKRCGVAGPMIGDTFDSELKKHQIFLPPDAASLTPAGASDAKTSEATAKMTGLSLEESGGEAAAGDSSTEKERSAPSGNAASETSKKGVGVWLCSHTGGHKFAGNLIVYPGGVWYGRVKPCHVPDIVEKHLLGGKVIRELYRGVFQGPEHSRTVGW